MKWSALFGLVVAAGLRAATPPPNAGPVVELPPMLVEGTGTSAPRWLYGQIPGFEVLSCASSDATEDLVARLYVLKSQLTQLVPASLQVHPDEPFTVILYPQSRADSLSQALNEQLARSQTRLINEGRAHAPPNLDLRDPDSAVFFSIVDDRNSGINWSTGHMFSGGGKYDGIVYSPEFVRDLLRERPPAPASWFVLGFSQLYGLLSKTEDGLVFGPDPWLSPAAQESAHQGGADAFRPTLPITELIQPRFPAEPAAAAGYGKLWLAEAELFVRWAIDGPTRHQYQTRPGLWLLAEASARGPVTEAMFRQYFGMGYADARDEMSDYLERAVWRPLEFPLDTDPEMPNLRLHLAAPTEIHRIKGDWARRTLRLVRQSHPTLLPIYIRQAREVLEGAYADGEKDPKLVADLGLLCSEIGSPAEGRRYLEEAFRSGPVRAAAAAQLAQLRLASARGQSGSAQPSPAEVASVLVAVRAARQLNPPQLLTYLVVADLCASIPGRVTAEERELLAEGAENFPDATALVISAVREQAAGGDRRRAMGLADLGLWRGPDSRLLAQLKSERNALEAKPTK